MLPPNYQQVVRELRKKGDTSASGEEGDKRARSGEVERQLRDSMIKVSLSLRIAGEETCAAFKDMGDMLDNLGIECGAIASDVAVRAVVDWLNLENQKDVSEAIKGDRQQIIVQDMESSMGYCTGDELGNGGEGPRAKDKAPQELSVLLNALEAHPMVVASPQAQQCVRQLWELFAHHLDGQDTQSGDTETTETIDWAS